MNSVNEELLKFAEIEEKYAEELRELAKSLKHPVLRVIFESISKDSEKHGAFYKAIATLVSEVQPFISEEDLERITASIEKHIRLESLMLEKAREILLKIEDPRVKLLAASIADDESKHHKLLLSIKAGIAEAETFTESMLWDLVWKESPWHGAPGG
ncbi:MAG: ferritin-like domain-containing protein [Desulfurococcaceae archaeon]